MRWALVLIGVLLVGCGSNYVCPDGSVVKDPGLCAQDTQEPAQPEEPAQEPVAEPEPEPEVQAPEEPIEEPAEPEQPEEEGAIDEKVREFITNAEKRVQSLKFLYVGPPDFMPQNTYSVKGDLVKIALLKATDHKISQPYTHVYLDNVKKTAIAYCEVREADRCKAQQDDSWELRWKDYYVRSPLDWLEALTSATYEGGGPTFENRKTHRVRFTTKDASGIMNILDFYSVPALIMLDDGSEIEFRDLEVNTLTDADMIHNPIVYPSRD